MNVRQLVKQASLLVDEVFPPPPGVVVLIYHRVGGGSGGEVDLDPEMFDAQLAHLGAHHRVLSLDEAVEALAAGELLEGVVLTFDDGSADFCDVVVPLLVRHGMPATLYAATQFIDEGVEFPWGSPPTSWSALRDAVSTGLVTVGSHTHGHWLLDRLAPSAVADDLDRSIDLIGSELGTEPAHFAYPKAIPGSPAAEVEIRRRFRSAALAANRVNRPKTGDVHRLWRTPIQRRDCLGLFAAKARGGLRLEGALRDLARRVLYAGQSN